MVGGKAAIKTRCMQICTSQSLSMKMILSNLCSNDAKSWLGSHRKAQTPALTLPGTTWMMKRKMQNSTAM
eukprot:6175574-Pleurochrysis_carterae.AAC.5